jgi:hypothetical protein
MRPVDQPLPALRIQNTPCRKLVGRRDQHSLNLKALKNIYTDAALVYRHTDWNEAGI